MSRSSIKIATGGRRQSMAPAHCSSLTAHGSTLAARFAGRPRRRAFALYLLTISIGMLLTATALTLITMQRAERRLQENIARTDVLRSYARAGLEMAIAFTEQVSDWRTRAASSSGKLFEDFAVGDGKVAVQVFDDADGQLANRDSDYVRIRCTAELDMAKFVLEGTLRPRPHGALSFACFGSSAANLDLKGNAIIQGPIRAHGPIRGENGDVVRDDASFTTMTSYTIEDPLTPKLYATTAISAPQPDLTLYEALSTVIAGDAGAKCEIKGGNFTPSLNTRGTANANGIYWLQAGNREVNLENVHVKGTLIITGTGGKKVSFGKGLFLEPGPLLYPVLLIDCPSDVIDVKLDATLSEPGLLLSLDVFGADMNGDGDALDTIPSQIRGAVWTNATILQLHGSAWFFSGCAISTSITVDDGVTVDNDLTLLNTFSPGFVQSGMDLVTGSIREVWP